MCRFIVVVREPRGVAVGTGKASELESLAFNCTAVVSPVFPRVLCSSFRSPPVTKSDIGGTTQVWRVHLKHLADCSVRPAERTRQTNKT